MQPDNLFEHDPDLADDADAVADPENDADEEDFDVKLPEAPPAPRKRRFIRRGLRLSNEKLVSLLRAAGYDATHIPYKLRHAALAIIGCWKKGLHDERDIATAIGRNNKVVGEVSSLLLVAGAS